MQIVYHIGVHCTDEGQIQYCLSRNRRLLATEGIIIPHPGKFRPVIRETVQGLNGAVPPPAAQEAILDSILTEDDPKRVILSNDGFLCGVPRILAGGTLYPDAAEKCQKLFNLFHDHEVEFCIGIRNPATFLPAVQAKRPKGSFADLLSRADPISLRWSEVIARIRAQLPEVPLKVWSNEDTPFIWRELLQAITGHDPATQLAGLDGYLATIMIPEGMERMEAYLETHPPANETQRRRILSAFLDKFEIDDGTQDVSAPGWTMDYIDALTDIYEEDLFEIERMPGVEFISP